MEQQNSLQSLSDIVQAFCEARDWDQFHGPKDLAIGVITEASELLKHFRFQSNEQALALLNDPESRKNLSVCIHAPTCITMTTTG